MAVTSHPFHTLAAQALKTNIRWQAARSVTDGATTASSTTVTSATANFTQADVGAAISGGSIPGGATISSVTNYTTVVISSAATSTATGVSLTITPTSDTFKMPLFTAAPTLTDPLYANLSSEVSSGGGYSTGGATLSSLTAVETEANSWGTSAATSTAYSLGDIVKPATGNGYLYLCVVAGTSGGTAPTWPTVVGETVTDGTVTWECIGTSITVYSSGSATWSSSTITASQAAIVDSTTGANVVEIDFGGSQSDSSGTFTVSPGTNGWFWLAGN